MITWIIAIGCLVAGGLVGAVIVYRFSLNSPRIGELENEIRELKQSHNDYRVSVSDHFGMTAELVQQMTESYQDVYQHLATGAQQLCTPEVAEKLLPTSSDAVFEPQHGAEETSGFHPPRDYAAKQAPDQKGALSEEFGLPTPGATSHDTPRTTPHATPHVEPQAHDQEQTHSSEATRS
ncbi:MAG: YhcB family protein [Pseudohongiellaceae bacterium]